MILKKSVPFDAQTAMKELAKEGIGSRPFFYPMHLQPVFKKMGWYAGEDYPVAENMGERGFYIPSGLALTEIEMKIVVEKLHTLFRA